MFVPGVGEEEVVVVEQVKGGDSTALEGIASDSGGAGVAEAGVVVVVAGGFVERRSGVESGVDS